MAQKVWRLKVKLSIFLAGIRTDRWLSLYQSIPLATSLPKEEYELVIVSPYDAPPELASIPNVRVVKDWGHMLRCYQLGVWHSKGEYVAWVADDGLFVPGLHLDKAFADMPQHKKGVASLKYFEGPRQGRNMKQEADIWWIMKRHKTLGKCRHVNGNYFMIMLGLLRRDYMIEIGGWDCRFQGGGGGSPDLAVRLQNDGAEVIVSENIMDVGHMPGGSGDHGPVVNALVQNDQPLFQHIYNSSEGVGRTKIDFHNWKQAENVWSRRFPEGMTS